MWRGGRAAWTLVVRPAKVRGKPADKQASNNLTLVWRVGARHRLASFDPWMRFHLISTLLHSLLSRERPHPPTGKFAFLALELEEDHPASTGHCRLWLFPGSPSCYLGCRVAAPCLTDAPFSPCRFRGRNSPEVPFSRPLQAAAQKGFCACNLQPRLSSTGSLG